MEWKQKDIQISGHAMECRINAENPEKNFMPCPGQIKNLHFPGGNGVRVDSAIYSGYQIPPYYDSMIAKLMVYDKDRKGAVQKMLSALGELVVEGVDTNVEFQFDILENEEFQKGNINTDFIETYF